MDADIDALLDEIAEWARSARLRGHGTRDIVTALFGSGLLAVEKTGVTCEQVINLVLCHYGTAPIERPAAKA